VLDIERFKTINDTVGRQGGDSLLKQIAERIVAAIGDGRRLGRVGADRFAFVIPNVTTDADVARQLEKRLGACFSAPFNVNGTELRISAKAGLAIFPSDGANEEELFANAESAWKRAKKTGDRYLFYTQRMTEAVASNLNIENKLRLALERNEFVLHYQPKIDLKKRLITGVEALIRWQSPDMGLVPPMQFIPLLEETGLITEVGEWALRQAASDYREWVKLGLSSPRVAVNVSSIQLRQRDFVSVITGAIHHEAAPVGIDLEITESRLMDDIAGNVEKLKAIRALGVQVAIDDFGTGHSSLAYLARLPVDTIKIDRSFVITMMNDPAAMTLVSTIISLAKSLKLKVVAEGVDAEEQASILTERGCDEMQGYLFSKPLPKEKLTVLLRNDLARLIPSR
jgi:diguanylate cyclase (GGDEF)-like protein